MGIRTGALICGVLLLTAGTGLTEDGPVPAAISIGKSSPQMSWRTPGYFDKQVLDVNSVMVEFYMAVKGIKPRDLTVNGSPATEVTGSGAGRYTFTGYQVPPLGKVEIKILPGEIVRDPEGIPFEGNSWTFELFAPHEDSDGDGLTNAQEDKAFTDMMKGDTDDDGIPDLYEVTHQCLDPIGDQAHPRGYNLEPLPGNDDADDDGLTDLEEFKKGSDPCLP